jgi:hypothetical protein
LRGSFLDGLGLSWLGWLLWFGLRGWRWRGRLSRLFGNRLARLLGSRLGRFVRHRHRLCRLLIIRLRRLLIDRLARLAGRSRSGTVINSNDSGDCNHRNFWLLLNCGGRYWLLVLVSITRGSVLLITSGSPPENLGRSGRIFAYYLDTSLDIVQRESKTLLAFSLTRKKLESTVIAA